MEQRQYSHTLIEELQTKTMRKVINGVEEIIKPVPGQDGNPKLNIVDPHVKMIIQKKIDEGIGNKPFSLNFDRNRPENITYDLTTSTVKLDEKLVEINGDHYIDTFIYSAENLNHANPILIYFHGGAFMTGKIEEFGKQMKFIAEQAKSTVIFPHYRLAPENPYPAAINDALGIINWVKANHQQLGSDNEKIILAGDSAGGNIINSCFVRLHNTSIIAKAVELYPAIDNDMEKYYKWSKFDVCSKDEKYAKNRVIRMLKSLPAFENNYLHHKIDPRDETVNLFNLRDWGKLPPIIFIVNQYDLLTLVTEKFIKNALEHNADLKVIKYMGCDHGSLNFFGTEPQAEDMCLEIAKIIIESSNQNESTCKNGK
jgi:acetyl esterase